LAQFKDVDPPLELEHHGSALNYCKNFLKLCIRQHVLLKLMVVY